MRILALVIALLIPTLVWCAESCSKEEAVAAESVAPYVESWSGLLRAFNEYKHCDDGAIGEGFSEAVAHVFGSGSNIHELQKLAKANPKFRAFVLRHIGATLLPEQLSAIEYQASRACPTGSKNLCKQISTEVQRARNEQKS